MFLKFSEASTVSDRKLYFECGLRIINLRNNILSKIVSK
jgi:hypothetical protein